MDMLSGLGTGLILLVSYSTGLGIGIYALAFALDLLAMPPPKFLPQQAPKRKELRDEIIIVAVLLAFSLGAVGWILGAIGFGAHYWWQHRRAPGDPPPQNTERLFPPVALSELLVMVLALGCMPLAFTALYMTPFNQLYVLIGAAVIAFVFAHLRLLQRANARGVPHGPLRLGLLFIYPYFLYATMFVCARGTVWVAFFALGLLAKLGTIMPQLPLRIGAAALVVLAGFSLIVLASRYKKTETGETKLQPQMSNVAGT